MSGGRRVTAATASLSKGFRLAGQQLRFEARDALVEEAAVGAGSLKAFFKDALPERYVLGAEPAGGIAVMLVLGVAELAEQLADAGVALGQPVRLEQRVARTAE
jgi:hypothetical protein